MQRALFLDRDNTLNYSFDGDSPKNIDEFKLIDPESTREALQRFKDNGYLIIVVSNQPNINKGLLTIQDLREMNQYLVDSYPTINHVIFCPHREEDECNCRKPKIGMLTLAAKLYDIDLSQSLMVGDSWRDEEAARAAGVKFTQININPKPSNIESLSVVRSMEEYAHLIFESSSHYFIENLNDFSKIVGMLNVDTLNKMVNILYDLKGRLFCIGIGGGAANASHAVNDFRKICNIEAYAITDNVAELTARINDNGWSSSFVDWLKVSRLSDKDCVFVFSVGGGSNLTSKNIVEAIKYAVETGAKIIGVVGRDGGLTGKLANSCILIPTISDEMITPFVESCQSLIAHLIVNHPKLQRMN